MSDQKNQPVLDEQTLDKLLEAAYVLQEHNRELQKRELNLQLQSDQLREREQQASQAAAKPSQAPSEGSASDDYTLTLAQIVETQRQIQVRHLELQDAIALITQRVAEIAKTSGAAVGILEGKTIHYQGASGSPALPRGSKVPWEKALCFACLRSGQVIRCADVNPEFLLDAEECRRRGIHSLIAVPVYHEGGIAGALELYFSEPQGFAERDVHTCQLMAGLVTEALARDAEIASKNSWTVERATMVQALEKLKPSLTALAGAPPQEQTSTRNESTASAISEQAFICRKCGHQLVGEEQFCGKCGSPREGDTESRSMQSKVASMWQMQQASRQGVAAFPSNGHLATEETAPNLPRDQRDAASAELHQRFAVSDLGNALENRAMSTPSAAESLEEPAESQAESELPIESNEVEDPASSGALVKSQEGLTWSSAAKARDFLEQLAASRNQSAFARFWNTRRGDIYLAIAVMLVAVAIRWGIWSDRSSSAPGTAVAASHRKQPAPDLNLSLFDKLLISVGLAEAPEAPENRGNPDTQVWVDLHTALYYCPGTDLYGKTPKGKYTSQRDAQMDQFEPAYRKACN